MRVASRVALVLAVLFAGCGGSTLDPSTPGAVWALTYLDDSAFTGMLRVVGGGPGLVAVEDDLSGDESLLVSADGVVWTRVEDEALFGLLSEPGTQKVEPSLLAGLGVGTAPVWVSANGYAWEPAYAVSGYLSSVVAGGPGVVAVSWQGTRLEVWVSADPSDGPAVWVSADGYAWVQTEPEGFDTWDSVNSLTAWGPRLVAAGCSWATLWGSCGPPGLVWMSTDGRRWTHAGEPDQEGQVSSVLVAGPGLIAAGVDYSGGQGHPAVWLSADGYDWTHADLEVPDGASGIVRSVASWAGGLVAVGECGSAAAVWLSPPPG